MKTTIKYKSVSAFFSLIVLFGNGSLQAQDVEIAAPPTFGTDRLSPANPSMPSINNSVDTINYTWAVGNDSAMATGLAAAQTFSQEYWFDVTGADLRRGVELDFSSEEALIQIAPSVTTGMRTRLSPSSLQLSSVLTTQANPSVRPKTTASMRVAANEKQMQALGFAPGSAALKVTTGNREFSRHVLKSNQSLMDSTRYRITVKEKDSPYQLFLTIPRQQYLPGQKISADISLLGVARNSFESRAVLRQSNIFLQSPKGRRIPLNQSRDRNSSGFDLQLPEIDSSEFAPGHLWELHAQTVGNLAAGKIRRNAKVAFSLVPATAKIESVLPQSVSADEVRVPIRLLANTAGRYQLSGVLQGTNNDGEWVPVLAAQQASWAEAGEATAELIFDLSKQVNDRVKPPYRVTELKLYDQSRLGLLHYQSEVK